MIVTEYIPNKKMRQFHDILCSTGGRYLRNPFPMFSKVEVHYEPGDYIAHREAWTACNTPIREKIANQTWRKILRRMKLFFSLTLSH